MPSLLLLPVVPRYATVTSRGHSLCRYCPSLLPLSLPLPLRHQLLPPPSLSLVAGVTAVVPLQLLLLPTLLFAITHCCQSIAAIITFCSCCFLLSISLPVHCHPLAFIETKWQFRKIGEDSFHFCDVQFFLLNWQPLMTAPYNDSLLLTTAFDTGFWCWCHSESGSAPKKQTWMHQSE